MDLCIVKCVCALLDFIFKALFPLQSEKTLDLMKSDLNFFWANVRVFIDISTRISEYLNTPLLLSQKKTYFSVPQAHWIALDERILIVLLLSWLACH